MKKLIVGLILSAAVAFGQGSGLVGGKGVQITTVAKLTTTLPVGSVAVVTDGSTATDCTAGGGANLVFCRWGGASWATFAAGAASAGGAVNTLQFNSAGSLGGVSQWTTPNGTTTIAASASAIWDASLVATANYRIPATVKLPNLQDAAGAPFLSVIASGGATDAFSISNGTGAVTFAATGGSANISVTVSGKGSGTVTIPRFVATVSAVMPATTFGGAVTITGTADGCATFATGVLGSTGVACGSGGGGAVSSVFTRTGAVVATSGDYTAAQVTNAMDKTAANTTGASFTLDASAASTLVGFIMPQGAGAAPVNTGVMAFDTTIGQPVWGKGGVTLTIPSNFVNDTNVTLSSSANNRTLTAGWTGTLAAARLNSNVVQSFTNDTNVTASISGQNATLGWTGTLAKARIISTAVYNDQSNTFSTGTQDFSAASVFRPKFGTVASLPGTCTVGDVYEATNATAGQNWYFCTATNTWTQQLNSGGGGLTATGSPANAYCAYFTSATSLSGNTGCTIDTSGNLVALSVSATGTAGQAGMLSLVQGTAPTATANAWNIVSPSSVTGTPVITLPGAAATGIIHLANSGGAMTMTISAVSQTADISGITPVANGGTNLSAATDDNVMVGNGTTWQSKAIPDCQDTGGNHLNYTATSNVLSCGNSGAGGGVSSVTGDGSIITNSGSTGAVTLVIAGTSGGIPYFSSASAWASSAALTANSPVLGGGAGVAPKVVAGITTDGTSVIVTGVAGSTVGGWDLKNATSGTISIRPVAGALGSVTLSLPARTATFATNTGTLTNGNVVSFDSSGNGIDSGITASQVITSSVAMTAHAVIIGNGGQALTKTAVGTTGIPLIGQTGADPVFGTCAVAGGCTGITSGTSGGVLGFTASGTVASSAALAANQPVVGGGAGATPTTLSVTPATLTDGATITWAIASAYIANATVTLGGTRTLNITNPLSGGYYTLRIVQDATGSRGLTLGTGCTWKVSSGGAGAITPTTAANAIDILAFYYDGTNCYANFNKNFN